MLEDLHDLCYARTHAFAGGKLLPVHPAPAPRISCCLLIDTPGGRGPIFVKFGRDIVVLKS